MKTNYAFSLGEVLLTLTIIGVIAAMTIPVVTMNSQQVSSEAGLKKAINSLDAALDLAKDDTKYQPYAKCFYWDQKPNDFCETKETTNPTTGERSWTCADGTPLPANYNGEFDQCKDLLLDIKDNMQTTKYCESAGLAQGCMPQYKGNDQVYKDDHGDTADKDITTATSGCAGWRSSSMGNKLAWVNSDGMIFFAYDKNWPGA